MIDEALVKWHQNVAHLRDLLQQTGWDTYKEYVDKVIVENTEALITSDLPGPATDWRKGYIMGLRRALQLPSEVVKNMKLARDN